MQPADAVGPYDGRNCRPAQLQRPKRPDEFLQAAVGHDAACLPEQIEKRFIRNMEKQNI